MVSCIICGKPANPVGHVMPTFIGYYCKNCWENVVGNKNEKER